SFGLSSAWALAGAPGKAAARAVAANAALKNVVMTKPPAKPDEPRLWRKQRVLARQECADANENIGIQNAENPLPVLADNFYAWRGGRADAPSQKI
ncbi:MAG TPA: hypothetical protein VD713_01665, partial [Sphingomonadales bacterium]|nr:hypothetical protein [Sphingomonadales bacterium]